MGGTHPTDCKITSLISEDLPERNGRKGNNPPGKWLKGHGEECTRKKTDSQGAGRRLQVHIRDGGGVGFAQDRDGGPPVPRKVRKYTEQHWGHFPMMQKILKLLAQWIRIVHVGRQTCCRGHHEVITLATHRATEQ